MGRSIYDHLHEYGDYSQDDFQTRLAEVADDILDRHEAREAARFQEIEVRTALASQGNLIDEMQYALQEAEHASLLDCKMPAVSTFDAWQVMRSASKDLQTDQGLKQASYVLQDVYRQNPHGHLTVGELIDYRDHFKDMYPKSAAKNVFDKGVADAGFQTLTNLPYLTRIASQVTDQESYEAAIRVAGLTEDTYEHIRARTYIRGLAECALNDVEYGLKIPTIQDAITRAAAKYAQMLDEDENPEESLGDEELEDSAIVHDADESEMPHDETSEEMASIESPVSGEELVIELGISDDAEVDGMEPAEGDDEMLPQLDSGSLPLPTRETTVASRRAQSIPDGSQISLDMPETEESDPAVELNDEPLENEGAEADSTSTTIVDPSSGQELRLTLEPVEDDSESDEPSNLPESSDLQEDASMPFQASKDGARQGAASKQAAKSKTQSKEKAMSPSVSGQPGPQVKGISPKLVKSAEEVRAICAKHGLTPSSVENLVLDGDWAFGGRELVAGVKEFGLGIDGNDQLTLARYTATGEVSAVLKRASLSDFDLVVGDFMAFCAASLPEMTAKAASLTPKKPAKAAKPAQYLVTTDVPYGAPINAQRMMGKVSTIVPNATGEMLDDGRLQIHLASATERDVNRIYRVLSDIFQVRNIQAQMLDATPEDSPFQGEAPVDQAEAGEPMAAQPMTGGMQTAATGQGAQADFMKRHLKDPLKLAQLDDGGDLGGDDDLGGDLPGEDDLGGGHEMPPMEGLDGDPSGEPPMDLGSPMGMEPPMAPPPMMNPPMMANDGSQVPAGINDGKLEPEDQKIVEAAMLVFRQEKIGPGAAVKKVMTEYPGLLEKYGEEGSASRNLAEAAIMMAASNAFSQAAVIPTKKAMSNLASGPAAKALSSKLAAGKKEIPEPKKINQQQPGAVKVKTGPVKSKDVPAPGAVKTQHKPQGDKPSTAMEAPESSGMPSPSAGGPQTGSQTKGKGTKKPTTQITVKTTEFAGQMDSVSSSAPSSYRSRKKADVIIACDMETGIFDLMRNTGKRIAMHETFSAALADAERRIYATDGSIWVDNGNGDLETV